MVRCNLFDCIVGERIFFRGKLSNFLPDHPGFKESLLVKELSRRILYLLCQTGLYITFNSMCLIVDNFY